MKRDQWEGGHRVPFLVRWPGKVKPGTTSAQLTSLTDVMATVAGIGTACPRMRPRTASTCCPHFSASRRGGPIRPYLLQQAFGGSRTLSIRRGNWKYLDHTGSGGNRYEGDLAPYALPEQESDAPGQLYDLTKDPGETTNLYFKEEAKRKELQTLLQKLKEDGRSAPKGRLPVMTAASR